MLLNKGNMDLFGGNPIAAAVAIAAMKLIQDEI
jgi:acetylornithine/succinyldiaminopimelate/putrescine aminotransferase